MKRTIEKKKKITVLSFIAILMALTLATTSCGPIALVGLKQGEESSVPVEISNGAIGSFENYDPDFQFESTDMEPIVLNEFIPQGEREVRKATDEEIEEIKRHINSEIPNYSPGSSIEFAMTDYRYSQCENDEQRRLFLEFVRQVTNDNPWCYVSTANQADFDRARNLYEHSVPFYRNYKLTEYSGHIVMGIGYYAVEYKVLDTDAAYYERSLQECVNYANTASDYLGKVNAINRWICGNIAYDWNHQSTIESSYTGSFAHNGTKGMTCCQGYSRFTAVCLSYAGISSHTVEGGIGTAGYHSYLYLQAQNGLWYVLDTCWEACGMHCWVLKGQASVTANDNQFGSHRTYDYEPALSASDFGSQDNFVVSSPIDSITSNHPIMTEQEKKDSIKSDEEKKEEERKKAEEARLKREEEEKAAELTRVEEQKKFEEQKKIEEKLKKQEEDKKKAQDAKLSEEKRAAEEQAKREEEKRLAEYKKNSTITGIEAVFNGQDYYLGDTINKSSIYVDLVKGDGSKERTNSFNLSKDTITDDGYGNCRVTVTSSGKSADVYIPFKMPKASINVSGNCISVSLDPCNINYNLYSANSNVVDVSGSTLIANGDGYATVYCDWSYKGYRSTETKSLVVTSQGTGDWQYAESAPAGNYEVQNLNYYKYYYFENGGHVPQWNCESVRLTYTEVFVPTPFSNGYNTAYNGYNFNTITVNGPALVSNDSYGWRVPTNFSGVVYQHESGEVISGVRYRSKTYTISQR